MTQIPLGLKESNFKTFDENIKIQYLIELLESINLSIVLTEKKHPYKIIFVNKHWINECGYKLNEIVGKTLKIIQGPLSCQSKINFMNKNLLNNNNFFLSMINYTKNKKPFFNNIFVNSINLDNNLDLFISISHIKPIFNSKNKLLEIDISKIEFDILKFISNNYNNLIENINCQIINMIREFCISLKDNKDINNNYLIFKFNYLKYDYNKFLE